MTVTPTPPPPSGSYTPPQGSSYTPPPGAPPAPAQKSGGCWKALAIGCGVILVLGFAAMIALFVFVFSVIKRSDVYREAFTRATSDPRVVEALGTPIEKGWWVMGSVHLDNNTGTANIDFPISGPKGSAHVHAAASYDGNTWTYSSLVVRPDAGGEIDVLHPAASSARVFLPKLYKLLI
ncbi:MAG TPA: cytochrome c oxidase assembly factor Coa1 family protein [Thermoanaerobaculia bacterium]|nr:cytochrome c oxidase assembly factor Coa1 family protein [Thermoanaerobaculia bacterium]